jgi:hypothetical protein
MATGLLRRRVRLFHFEPFAGERQFFDRHIGSFRVHRAADVLDNPSMHQLPGLDNGALIFVLQVDENVAVRVSVTIADVVEPPIQVPEADDPTLQGDVSGFIQPGDFADVVFLFIPLPDRYSDPRGG